MVFVAWGTRVWPSSAHSVLPAPTLVPDLAVLFGNRLLRSARNSPGLRTFSPGWSGAFSLGLWVARATGRPQLTTHATWSARSSNPDGSLTEIGNLADSLADGGVDELCNIAFDADEKFQPYPA